MTFVHKYFVSFKTGCSVKRSLTGTVLIFADAMQSFPVQHERLVPRKPFSTVLTCHNMSSLSPVAFSKEYDVPWSIEGFGCHVEISDHD